MTTMYNPTLTPPKRGGRPRRPGGPPTPQVIKEKKDREYRRRVVKLRRGYREALGPMTHGEVDLLLSHLEDEGLRIFFTGEDGLPEEDHDRIRHLVSNLVAEIFLSSVGFAFQSPGGVFAIPGRVGSIVIKEKKSYTLPMPGPGGPTTVVPETLKVKFTPSKQIQRTLLHYWREQKNAAKDKNPTTTKPQPNPTTPHQD